MRLIRFWNILTEEDDKEAAHLEKLNACKKAVHTVLSKHGCKLQGTRFGVLVASTSGAKQRIKL